MDERPASDEAPNGWLWIIWFRCSELLSHRIVLVFSFIYLFSDEEGSFVFLWVFSGNWRRSHRHSQTPEMLACAFSAHRKIAAKRRRQWQHIQRVQKVKKRLEINENLISSSEDAASSIGSSSHCAKNVCANESARASTLTHTSNWINCTLFLFRSLVLLFFLSHFKEMFSKNLTSFAGDFEHGSKVDMARSRGRAHTARTSEREKIEYKSAPPSIVGQMYADTKKSMAIRYTECWRCNALYPSNRVCVQRTVLA